jgi:hypothetical protein
MKASRGAQRVMGRRWASGLCVTALLAGLVTVTTSAHADGADMVEGGVYGWGVTGAGAEALPWGLEFDNEQSPFVDVAVHGGAGTDHTTLAVTSSGDVVAQGDADGVVSEMPTSLAAEHVVAVDVYRGAAAAVTQSGEIIAWNDAAEPSQECQDQAGAAGAVDVQLGGRDAVGSAFGVVLKGDGTLCAWGRGADRAPAVGGIVKIQSNEQYTIALTSDGDIHAWTYGPPLEVGTVSEDVADATIIDIATSQYVGYALTDEGAVLAWGGNPTTGVPDHAQFPDGQVDGKVIALAEPTTHEDQAKLAVTDRGELIAWGFGISTGPVAEGMTTPPGNLEGREVVAMATSARSHHALILGDVVDVDHPDPITVTAQPSITGDATTGATLTATPATFSETDGVTLTHQWYAADGAGEPVALEGQTGTTLELTTEHVDKTITYTTAGQRGEETPVVSDPSNALGPVVQADLPDLAVESAPTIALEAGAEEPRVGVTVEASPAVFNQDDGLSIEHRWFRDGERLEGVDTSTYTLTPTDLGAQITYRTHAVRSADSAAVTSDPSGPIGPVVPVELVVTDLPVIDGRGYIGVEHTVTAGPTTDDENVSHTFEWTITFEDERDPVTIEGSTFAPVEEHRDGMITVTQTSTRGEESVTATSMAVGPVRDRPAAITIESEAAIDGEPYFGETIVGTPATFSETDDVTVEHYWVRLSTNTQLPAQLDDDGKARMALTEEHKGDYIVFRSVANREGDDPVISTSPYTAMVGPIYVRLAGTSDPEIGGTPRVGEELTVSKDATFNDTQASVSVAYRWYAGEEQVGTGKSLMLTEAHVGRPIIVEARAVRGADTATATSAPTDPVLGPVVDSETTVAVRPETGRFGLTRTAMVTVAKEGGTPAGEVTVRVGSATRTATLTDGTAKVRLARLRVGRYNVTATYAGDETTRSSSSTARLVVRKAPTRSRINKIKVKRHGKKVIVKVKTHFPAGVAPAGRTKIVIKRGKKTIAKGKAKVNRHGVAKLVAKRLKKRKYKVKATYLGNRNIKVSKDARRFRVR